MLSQWGVQADLGQAPCIWLVRPLFDLMLAGKWSTLMIERQPWVLSVSPLQFPPRNADATINKGKRKKQRGGGGSASVAQLEGTTHTVCDDMRTAFHEVAGWAGLVGHSNVQSILVKLDKARAALETSRKRISETDKSKWSAGSLIHAVVATGMLKNRAHLQDIVKRCTAMLVDSHIGCAALLDEISIGTCAPTPSTVRQATLSLDAAIMLNRRDQNLEDGWSFFYWADASPQGGFDWLIIQYVAIRDADLPHFIDAFSTVVGFASEMTTLLEADEFADQQEAIESVMCRWSDVQAKAKLMCAIHTQVPISIGTRAATVEHKLRALLHGIFLETHPPHTVSVPRMCSQVCSFTTDLGTEAGFSDYYSAKWTDLMPSWLRAHLGKAAAEAQPPHAAELMPDGAGNDDDMHLEFDFDCPNPADLEIDGGTCFDAEAAGDNATAMIVHEDEQHAVDVDELQADMQGSADAMPDVEEAGNIADNDNLFPNALVVAGILHIVANIMLKIDSKLSMWSEWLAGLKSIVALLSEGERRRMYIATCVSTDFPHLVYTFRLHV